jgi:HAD superfamily hydrolase (TIGR01549 family)
VTRAVLFDLDDTLFDHRGASRAALAEVHRRHAGGTDFEAFEDHHARILEELHLEVLAGARGLDDARRERFRRVFEAVGITLSDGDADAVAAAYRAGYVPSWRAVDGAAELVAAVRRHARVGVVSNNLIEETRDKLVFCRIAPLVDAVVVSGDEGISKPDPRIFHIALERLSAAAGEAVMFGDSWTADIVGAARAGIRAVWFNPRRKPRPADPPRVEEVFSLTPVDRLAARLVDRREHSGERARRDEPGER